MRLLCQSPLLFSLLLLLALLSLACGQSANYTVLYVSYPACDLAVDISGFIYIGLCTGGVERFNASASLDSTYQARYASALNSSSAYMRPLKAELYAVSASGTVWAMDSLNEQLVGVSNVGPPQRLRLRPLHRTRGRRPLLQHRTQLQQPLGRLPRPTLRPRAAAVAYGCGAAALERHHVAWSH